MYFTFACFVRISENVRPLITLLHELGITGDEPNAWMMTKCDKILSESPLVMADILFAQRYHLPASFSTGIDKVMQPNKTSTFDALLPELEASLDPFGAGLLIRKLRQNRLEMIQKVQSICSKVERHTRENVECWLKLQQS
jgi:hypothetical protein